MNEVRQQPLLAFTVALAGIGALSTMDAVMKSLSIAIGAYPTMLWRALLATLLLALPYALSRPRRPTARALRLHALRGVVMVPMGLLFFWGLARTPMAQAIALTFVAPLIALGLAALFLKEKVGGRTLAGSLLAALGVALIFLAQARADLGRDALLGSLAILGSALCYAVNIVVMRRQAQHAGVLEIGFFQFLFTGIGFWLAVPFTGGVPPLPMDQALPLLVATLLSIAGMLMLAFAYARAEAAYLSVSEYSGFVYAAALGWLVFGEIPSPFTVAGAALIVAGCLYAARPAAAPRATPASTPTPAPSA